MYYIMYESGHYLHAHPNLGGWTLSFKEPKKSLTPEEVAECLRIIHDKVSMVYNYLAIVYADAPRRKGKRGEYDRIALRVRFKNMTGAVEVDYGRK